MANYYSYNTNQVQADINMDNAIKDIQNQLLNIPTDSQLSLKANQTDLDTTNVNVAANTTLLADIAHNIESFPLQIPETDDSARFLRLITSLGSNGGIITFSQNKTYTFLSQVTFSKNNLTIIIPIDTIITTSQSLAASLIKITSSTNVHIYGNGTIDGANSGTVGAYGTNYQYGLIEYSQCTDCTVEQINFKNTNYVGVRLNSCTTCKVLNNTMDSCIFGVWIEQGLGNSIRDNRMNRTVMPGDASVGLTPRGIRGSNTVGALISGNRITNYELSIECWGGGKRNIVSFNNIFGCPFGISIASNTFSSVIGNNVEADGTNTVFNEGIELAQSSQCTVQGNTLNIGSGATTGSRVGIALWSGTGSHYNSVSGNTIKGGLCGVAIEGGSFNTIAENTIQSPSSQGIRIWGSSSGASQNNNILAKNTIDSTNIGINLRGNAGIMYCTISENMINNPTAQGLDLEQAFDGTGVIATPTDFITVLNNQIIGAQNRGLQLYGIPHAVVKGNTVKNSKWSGIYVYGSNNPNTSVEVEGNFCSGNVTDTTKGAGSEAGVYVNGNYANATYLVSNNMSSQADNNNYANVYATPLSNVINKDLKKLASKTIGTTQTTIYHGVGGYVPQTIIIKLKGNVLVWESANADSNNIYLTAGASTTVDIYVG